MKINLAHVALLVLGAIALVGVILLSALGHAVPDVLPTMATVALAALAGIAAPAAVIQLGNSLTGPGTTPTPAAPATLAAVPAAPVALVASQSPAPATIAGGVVTPAAA